MAAKKLNVPEHNVTAAVAEHNRLILEQGELEVKLHTERKAHNAEVERHWRAINSEKETFNELLEEELELMERLAAAIKLIAELNKDNLAVTKAIKADPTLPISVHFPGKMDNAD